MKNCFYQRKHFMMCCISLPTFEFVISNLGYGSQTASVTKDYDFMMYFMKLPNSLRSEIGHHFSDLVKGCTFHGQDCLDERYVITLFLVFFLKNNYF